MRARRSDRRVAAVVAVAGAIALVGLGSALLVDGLQEGPRREAATRIADRLGEAAQGESRVARILDAHEHLETERSLARQRWQRSLAHWTVLSAVVFLIAARRLRGPLDRYPDLPSLRAGRVTRSARPRFRSVGARRRRERPEGGPEDGPSIEEIVADAGSGPEATIPVLQAIQRARGHLPPDELRRVAELAEISPARLEGSASFYARFRRRPAGELTLRICRGTACHVAGADRVTDELRRRLELLPGEDTDRSRRFTLEEVACLGCCNLAPVVVLGAETVGRVTAASAGELLEAP